PELHGCVGALSEAGAGAFVPPGCGRTTDAPRARTRRPPRGGGLWPLGGAAWSEFAPGGRGVGDRPTHVGPLAARVAANAVANTATGPALPPFQPRRTEPAVGPARLAWSPCRPAHAAGTVSGDGPA